MAMSREDVEFVQRGVGLFNAGEFDAALEALHPDVELTPGVGPLMGVETLRGRAAAQRFWREDLPSALADFRVEPLGIEDMGDYVLVESRYHARGPGSGIEIDQAFWTVY